MSVAKLTEPLVDLQIGEGIAVIALNDPARRNILSQGLAEELIAAVDRAEMDASVKVVIVTGRGSAFCGGADLGDLIAAGEGNTEPVQKVYDSFSRIASCTKPTIAAVNGPAVGAGMNVALACDVIIADGTARFDTRFLAISIHQGGGHAWMLARRIGPQAASALLLFGQAVSAEDARRIGLAWEVAPAGEALAAAQKFASRAAKAPLSLLRAIKDTLATTPDLPTRVEAMSVETRRQLESLRSPEAVTMIAGLKAIISRG
jgi:enoyl-CoA hydratase